ncbi:ATP-grasp domain-containing protein [Jeotgalibacillus salarius]|uniref:ATP-grasp domain-containing protein n=1 Tax=Jeotgalibacillus salarius TaxID=546023 RepID=A0A4Y8LGY5_9BACL|nr:ATP-grasp domain-containing protein [Jeotgalibacillus salarius]TFE01710.1 ATP-grasp domain-containing protein [Jeotgalibacillus salarius]
MNILLTSAGRRGYLVSYFKEVLAGSGEVHVTNSEKNAPSFHYADQTAVSPLIHDPDYISFLLNYCREHQIHAIIPLFDIDLPVLASQKKLFEQSGVQVVVSDPETIFRCNDKWETFLFLKKIGVRTPRTLLSIEETLEEIHLGTMKFPVIIKPRFGMGSIGIYEAENEEELSVFFNKIKKDIQKSYLKFESGQDSSRAIIIQEKMNGDEYGLDVMNDLDGNYQNTVVKKKYAMRSGETDCAEIVNSSELKELGRWISDHMRHIGNLDVDVFSDGQSAYVLEMNARFGGGYPFTHISGVNLPFAICQWLQGNKADPDILREMPGTIGHKDIHIIKIENQKSSHTY